MAELSKKLTLALTHTEMRQLRQMSAENFRQPTDQARVLIRKALGLAEPTQQPAPAPRRAKRTQAQG